MSNKTELFKKFMVQKSVLDTLRVYIDITDDFLAKMRQNGLLEEDEVMMVKKLGWPSSRNQLLQMLIKKQWDKKLFNSFCDVLKETQKDEKFQDTFNRKVEDFMQGNALELAEAEGAPKDPVESMLDNILLGLPLSDQIRIRTMLKEKDDEIFKQKARGDELVNQLQAVTQENVSMKTQLHDLDKAATDLVSSFQYETEPVTLEQGLGIVRSILDARQATITQLQSEQKELQQQLDELKDWTSKLTSEVIELKEQNAELEKELKELKEKYREEVFDLTRRLDEEQAVTEKLKSRLKAMEKYYRTEVRKRDEALEHIKIELSLANKRLHDAQEERDKAVEELETNSDKTRKLLVSLGLENECKTLGLSLDFARNITYVNKKVITKTAIKPKLNPISIEHPQNDLKTDKKDQDVVIRPYPEPQYGMSEGQHSSNKHGQPIRTGSVQPLATVNNSPRKPGYQRNLPPL